MAKKQPPKASVPPAETPTTSPDSKAVDQGKQKPKTVRAKAEPAAIGSSTTRAPAREPRVIRQYSEAEKAVLTEECLEYISNGGSGLAFAKEIGVTVSTVYGWLGEVEDRYQKARADRAHGLFEEIKTKVEEPVPSTQFGTTDSGAVQLLRLKVDTYKWMASKLLPKTYGDKLEVDAKVQVSMVDRLKALEQQTIPTHETLPANG